MRGPPYRAAPRREGRWAGISRPGTPAEPEPRHRVPGGLLHFPGLDAAHTPAALALRAE